MKKRTRWEQARFSFVLGVGGGLVPCPAALASYVTALGAGNTQQGIWGIFVFSIGIFLSVSLMTWLLLKTSGRWLKPGNSRLTQFVLYARLILMVSTGLYLIFLSEVPHVHA
jgi:ABC-type nickel/cobalt efflux system permease component RcnA